VRSFSPAHAVVLVLVLAALVGLAHAARLGYYAAREHRLSASCIEQGKVPLWQPAGPDDTRPTGALRFSCVAP